MRQRRDAWHAKPNLAARKNALYGMARAWEALAKYIEHHEEARAEATKDADWWITYKIFRTFRIDGFFIQ
jgi:hypothetical protein